MANAGAGARGALGGAATGASIGSVGGPWGAAIGGAVGAVGGGLVGLFGGGDDGPSDEDRAKLIALYQGYLDTLPGGPKQDPQAAEALRQLKGLSETGMSPDIMAALLKSRTEADQMAQGRTAAIQNREASMGRGVANSGQSAVMQAQAAQDGATRAQAGGMEQVAIAARNKREALAQYLQQLSRNDQLRLQATGGLAGAYGKSMDFHGAQAAADNANTASTMNTVGAAGMYAANKYAAANKDAPAASNPNPADGTDPHNIPMPDQGYPVAPVAPPPRTLGAAFGVDDAQYDPSRTVQIPRF